jgi:peptide/nickel transport system permease protein
VRRWRKAAGRLVSGLFVVWAAVTLTFIAMRLLPGDPVTAVLGRVDAPPPEVRAAVIEQYGFDQPIVVQYAHYVGHMLTGNFGESYTLHQSVGQVLRDQARGTIPLAISALVLAWILAVAWITLTAGRRRAVRELGSGLEILAISTPQLWLAILLLLVFSLQLRWFPVSGGSGVAGLVLPTLALAIPLAGYLGQVTREAFEHALEQPNVLTARARGMGDLRLRFTHVLRHASIPGVTLSGFALGWLLSGAVVVETVFGRPGLGATLLKSVTSRDVPVIGAIVVISALVYVIANLAVDFLYPVIDPRIRHS